MFDFVELVTLPPSTAYGPHKPQQTFTRKVTTPDLSTTPSTPGSLYDLRMPLNYSHPERGAQDVVPAPLNKASYTSQRMFTTHRKLHQNTASGDPSY